MARRRNKKHKPSKRNAPIQNDAKTIESAGKSTNDDHPPFPSSRYDAYQQEKKTSDKWKRGIEIGTLLFACCAVVTNLYIFGEMQKTTQANKLSADAAAASTAAWIVVEEFNFKGITDDTATFEVVFKNVGKTPALNATAGWQFAFLPGIPWLTGVPKFEPFECPETSVSMGIVGPEKTWTLSGFRNRLTTEQVAMIKAKTGKIFIHGCAKYRDVLTDRERISEVGGYFPGRTDPSNTSVMTYSPYNRLK